MSKIKVITDSTSDIPKELVEQYNIRVLPLKVYFGTEEYKDGIDLTPSQFFEKLTSSEIIPTTSQVTPLEFEEAFKEELEHNDCIICITLSSKASGTYQSAVIAKQNIEGADIELIDSQTFSVGYGMIAVEAARMAMNGSSKEDIIKQIHSMLERLEIYFIVDTLEYLKKGGRINLASAIIGSILDIKPILAVKDGLVVPIEKIRGSKRVIPKMIEIIKSKGYNLTDQVVALVYGNQSQKLEELKAAIEKEFNPKGFIIIQVGSVIGAHVGPGVMGIFFLK